MIRPKENGAEEAVPERTIGDTDGSGWRLETLGKVAEGMVHDFNNILAAISGFAELILNSGDGAERESVRDFARNILQAARSGQMTVRDLRAFTRRPGAERERLDAHEVLAQAVSMARAGQGGKAAFTADFMPGPAPILGSRAHLRNAFLDLFHHARDSMPQGGHIEVKTRLSRPASEGHPDSLIITVRDSGEGMSEAVSARIFEPFFTTRGKFGNGLGLVNVEAAVKAHGGSITVDSALGRGTEFRILLPLRGGSPLP
jgi:signal transduction histidine kinase